MVLQEDLPCLFGIFQCSWLSLVTVGVSSLSPVTRNTSPSSGVWVVDIYEGMVQSLDSLALPNRVENAGRGKH
jgi:hypothetical protein